MARFLTILEGEGQGRRIKLDDKPYLLVGRSSTADLRLQEDKSISRGHLEIRLEPAGVFVKNLSEKGSLLNGKRLEGEVSLNSGDQLIIGHTKLGFEETQPEASDATLPAPSDLASAPSISPSGAKIATGTFDTAMLGRTVAAPPDLVQRAEEEESEDGGTRALAEDHTRMANADELGKFIAKSAGKEKAPGVSGLWAALGLVLILAIAAGGFWFWQQQQKSSEAGVATFKDQTLAFELDYPGDFSKIHSDKQDVVTLGVGADSAPEWARIEIAGDKQPDNALTGITDGFNRYQDVLRKRFTGFELVRNALMPLDSGPMAMVFAFRSPAVNGKGIYVLNAEARIVVLGFAPGKCYDKFLGAAFNPALSSFRLTSGEPQEFIDFAPPDAGMRALALSNPSGLARQVDTHIRQGEELLAQKDIRPDNLYRSVHEFRSAMQLATASPQPLPTCTTAAQGLVKATRFWNQALDRQRFEISLARKERDWRKAEGAALKMMQMAPDKNDPAYQEAYSISKAVPKGE